MSLTIFVKKILQPVELATEAFANLNEMSKEGRGDSGQPPTWISAPGSWGGGTHLAFMPSTVIQISIGAVHGPVAHGDDPRPDCPVLIGFLQRRAQSEGRGAVVEEGVRRHIPGDIQRLPGGRSPASETVSLPGGGRNGGRNIPRWRRR